ncbi:Alcohol dehydrogenase (NADP(+)) [Purpureocillium takamizusanense]|uniref:Alcohol dehydrogenase (NADP(+)) n=1 Tax=Purpureocillium takamizusanense TaxID=2060973 RepID=A0A9Q8VHE8_9HYPO|nr:Alcohol dehydrogenase (NADP(+)) [Purpureocillium takamizusanense]UNI24722.1 Alcohol dehydrogenase (NADP(+)) [Purpureocillium takamizusanense]
MPTFTVFKGGEGGKPKESTTTKPDQLVGDNVLVKVTASGVCGTDLHYLTQDMVLGHEGVGIVQDLGPDVKFLRRGQRVGWGYETNSCGHCMECLQGEETFCPQRVMYGMPASADQGSFAAGAVWREAFLHPLPDALPDEHAAPLQCGGATVFTALQGVRPGETVGVMGVGGLGHLAIQFAAKMGCRVVVLSGSERKKGQALELGAHEFVAMSAAGRSSNKNNKDGQQQQQQQQNGEHDELEIKSPINRLLVTTSAQPQWDVLLPLLAPRSQIYPLSVDGGNFEFPYMPILAKGIRIQGVIVATRAVHREMLDFAAFHDVRPIVEKFPMTEEGIAAALDRLEKGQVTYRAVLMAQ